MKSAKRFFSKSIFPLHFWPPKQRFDRHNVTPRIFLKQIRVGKQHDLYKIGLARVFCRHLQNKFRFWWNIPENPSNIATLPVKSLFPETTLFMFSLIFGIPSCCAPINSILNFYSCSQKVELKTCTLKFLSLNISISFVAVKTVDMVPILSGL